MRTNARRAIFYVFIAAVIVLSAELIVVDVFGGSQIYAVVSGSMAPTLDVGDMVVARTVAFSSIHVGDVIVYNAPTSKGTCSDFIVVHRVVGVASNGGLITQGDNRGTNPIPDEPTQWPYVSANCVRGEVLLSIPYLGTISTIFPPPYNYALMAAILVLIFLIEYRAGGVQGEGERALELRCTGVRSLSLPIRTSLIRWGRRGLRFVLVAPVREVS